MVSKKTILYTIKSRDKKERRDWLSTLFSNHPNWHSAKGMVNQLVRKYPDREFKVDVMVKYTITPSNNRF